MHDMVVMAIVDARQNLLHEQRSILFCELASSNDLVEELSTLADVCDDVVSLFVFKELVHLEDIGVIKVLQVVDLVEEHLLLIFVHV